MLTLSSVLFVFLIQPLQNLKHNVITTGCLPIYLIEILLFPSSPAQHKKPQCNLTNMLWLEAKCPTELRIDIINHKSGSLISHLIIILMYLS